MKKLFICLLLTILVGTAMAQNHFKDMRRTYLWDVTLSMKGYGGAPNIYEAVVDVIVRDIEAITDQRIEIVVVPFQNTAYCDVWRTMATPQGKKDIISKIRNYNNATVTGTCISAPLEYAINNIFTTDRIDIMYLMTDGNDNVNPAKLNAIMNRWCQIAEEKDVYGYYILLTDAARNGDLSIKLKGICRFKEIDANGNLAGINSIAQESARFAEGIFINIRDEYKKPKRLEFVQYLGTEAPEGFKIHFRTRPNPYVHIDETATMRADNSVELHPQFLMSQDSLKVLLPELSADSLIWLDYQPTSDMAAGQFAFTRLIDSQCQIFLVNKPEKTVRIAIKQK